MCKLKNLSNLLSQNYKVIIVTSIMESSSTNGKRVLHYAFSATVAFKGWMTWLKVFLQKTIDFFNFIIKLYHPLPALYAFDPPHVLYKQTRYKENDIGVFFKREIFITQMW